MTSNHDFGVLCFADGATRFRDGFTRPVELDPIGTDLPASGESDEVEPLAHLAPLMEGLLMEGRKTTVVVTVGKQQPHDAVTQIHRVAQALARESAPIPLIVLRPPTQPERPDPAVALQDSMAGNRWFTVHDGVLVLNCSEAQWALCTSEREDRVLLDRPLPTPTADSEEWRHQWNETMCLLHGLPAFHAIVVLAESAWDEAQTGELVTCLKIVFSARQRDLPVLVIQHL